MDEQKRTALSAWLDQQAGDCRRRGDLLQQDSRGDEAVFEKIRANIYGVFQSILAAAYQSCGDDAGAARQFFLDKAAGLSACWEQERERAQAYGGTDKARLESIKLEAARQCTEKFRELWGVNA